MANPTTQLLPDATAATVGTSAATVLQPNPTRNGLLLFNGHASQTISIAPSSGAVPVSLAAGTLLIAAGATLFFGGPTFPVSWTDGIQAIASGASTPLTILEW